MAGGLEVDVRGAGRHGRFERRGDQPSAGALDRAVCDEVDLAFQPALVRHCRPTVLKRAEPTVELPLPVRRPGGQDQHFATGGEDQTRQGLVIQRIAGGAGKRLAVTANRHHPGAPQEIWRDPKVSRFDLAGLLGGLPGLTAADLGIDRHEVVVRKAAELVQHLLHGLTGADGNQFGACNRRGIGQALLGQRHKHGLATSATGDGECCCA